MLLSGALFSRMQAGQNLQIRRRNTDLSLWLEYPETLTQHRKSALIVDMFNHMLRKYIVEYIILKWERSCCIYVGHLDPYR